MNPRRRRVSISLVRGALTLTREIPFSESAPAAFGPFRVLHQIGAGSLGPVFRAYDPQRDRLVAVKVFRLDATPEQARDLVAALQRPIDRRLADPAIAAPIAVGMEADHVYLAQEYVAADSLDAVLRQSGRLSPPNALRLLTRLAGAIDRAAAADVHHGALHPRDVLMVEDDEGRVTGWGVAAALERVGLRAPVRRPYSAPERVEGASWGSAADLFSLAAIGYELLYGRRLTGPVDRVSIPPGDLDAAEGASLAGVFATALAADASERYPDALTFAHALEVAVASSAAEAQVLVGADQAEAPHGVVSATASAGELPDDETGSHTRPTDVTASIASSPTAGSRPARAGSSRGRAARGFEPTVPPIPDIVLRPDVPLDDAELRRLPLKDVASWRPQQSRSVGPMAAMLVVGLAVGFAGGTVFWSRRDPGPAPSSLTATSPAPAGTAAPIAGRLWTEGTVREAPVGTTSPPAPAPAVPAEAPPRSRPGATRPNADVSRPPPRLAAPGARGAVLVRSTPAGASLTIDGKAYGVTPQGVRDLGFGSHTIQLSRSGYEPQRRVVTLSAERPSASLEIPLRPRVALPERPVAQFGSLAIDSRPVGARVFVDGQAVGATPLVIDRVPVGDHVVRVERDGYRRWESSVRILAGGRHRLAASLEGDPRR